MRTHIALSSAPIQLHDVDAADQGKGFHKPRGFWYEVNGDWQRWASGESFTIGKFVHRVDLNNCRVLPIRSVATLDAFHVKYGVDSGRHSFKDIHIDWARVAAEFDGVEISPYQWRRRLHIDFMWYYGWDCASGVIWRPKNAAVTYLHELSAVAVEA